jgi:crossover junction endodeoxyribonuclease RuvC
VDQGQVILGIDPGTNVMGYGLITVMNKKMHYKAMGVINLSKIDSHELKLKSIFENTTRLIEENNPESLAIEAPFFGKNVQSMLKLGRAQGVAIAAAISKGLTITEYSPKKIKQSITGNGNASKEQVALMLKSLLSIKEMPELLDATDGLAAAVCHFFQGKIEVTGKKFNSWEAFVKNNEQKIIKK